MINFVHIPSHNVHTLHTSSPANCFITQLTKQQTGCQQRQR